MIAESGSEPGGASRGGGLRGNLQYALIASRIVGNPGRRGSALGVRLMRRAP